MSVCHYCHKSDGETCLFPYKFKGKDFYVCVECYHKHLNLDEIRNVFNDFEKMGMDEVVNFDDYRKLKKKYGVV